MQHKFTDYILLAILLLTPLISLGDEIKPDVGDNPPPIVTDADGKELKEQEATFITAPHKAALQSATEFPADKNAPPDAPDDIPNDPDLKPITTCDYAIDETRKKKCQELFFKRPSDMTDKELFLMSELEQLAADTVDIDKHIEKTLLEELRNKEKTVTGGKGLGETSDVKNDAIGWKAKPLVITIPQEQNHK